MKKLNFGDYNKSNHQTDSQSINSNESNLTFSQLKEEIIKFYFFDFQPKNREIYERTFKHLIILFGEKPISEITQQDIETYKSYRLKQTHNSKPITKTTVNMELRTIKTIFNKAVHLGHTDHNPCRGIKQLKIPEKEILSFSKEEFKQLLSVIDNYDFRNIVLFAFYTGVRRNELINIQWGDIDLERQIVRIRNKENFQTKTGENRDVPICNELKTILINIRDSEFGNQRIPEDGYLFHAKNTEKLKEDFLSKKFKKYIRNAGLPEKYHFHCLRHSFTTQLLNTGAPIHRAQKACGHKLVETTLRYLHARPEEMLADVNRLSLAL